MYYKMGTRRQKLHRKIYDFLVSKGYDSNVAYRKATQITGWAQKGSEYSMGTRPIECRITHYHGNDFVEIRFNGEEWNHWLFPMSITPKKYWIYVPELKVYRRNTSIQ